MVICKPTVQSVMVNSIILFTFIWSDFQMQKSYSNIFSIIQSNGEDMTEFSSSALKGI